MKILKTVGYIYLGILILIGIAIFLLFPIFMVKYFNNENYFFIFLINLPIFFAVMFQYMDFESGRPKK